MIIYIAGLLDIPKELYEAAMIDGANHWHRMRSITVPMLSPVILFNVTIGLIGGFQYFVQPYVITGGGPVDSTLVYALYLFQNAFEFFRMGYASAMAWLLFVIIIIVTALLFKGSARFIHYRG